MFSAALQILIRRLAGHRHGHWRARERNDVGPRLVAWFGACDFVRRDFGQYRAAANWLEKTIYLLSAKLRFGGSSRPAITLWALDTIRSRIQHQGRTEFWNSDLQIQSIEQVKEVAFRPWADGTIPRRFCTGRALTSDGKWHVVRYSIVEDGGMIGANWGVQWCVVGLDRNWAYNPACKAASP